jgi:hypothetical protein
MAGGVVPRGHGAEDDQSKPESFCNGSGVPKVHALVPWAAVGFCIFHRGIVSQDWSRQKRQTGMNFWSQFVGSHDKLADSLGRLDPDFGAR